MLRRGRRYGLEDRAAIREAIDAIEQQTVEVNIEIGRGAKALDEGHRAGLRLGAGQSGTAMSAAWLSVGWGSGLPPAQPASGEARKKWSDTQSVPCSQWLYFRHESVKKLPQDCEAT